jgi:Tfp pilus assembly protein PilO
MRIEKGEWRALVAALLVGTGLVLGLWLPQHARRRQLTAQIEQADQTLRTNSIQGVGLTALSRKAEVLKVEADAAQQRVPPQQRLGDLLRQLSQHANAQHVTGLEVVTKATVAGADYSMIPLVVQFHGPFPAVFGLLRDLEQMPRLVRVSRVDLHGDPAKPGEPLAATIELYTFYAPGEEVRP